MVCLIQIMYLQIYTRDQDRHQESNNFDRAREWARERCKRQGDRAEQEIDTGREHKILR